MKTLSHPKADATQPLHAVHLLRGALRRLALFLFAGLSPVFITACASWPDERNRPDTVALVPDITGPIARAAFAGRPDDTSSGFRLMPSGPHALATRLELIQNARRSLDLQYFIVQSDATGKELLRLLRDAAQRGVRVRLLVDDLYTQEQDDLFTGLAAHDNVEVRLFNPFAWRDAGVFARFAAQPLAFERLNHRMHNKLFIADGVAAITGGRNIGDEYFSRRDAGNFIDLDVLSVGPVVQQMAAQFDRYWNNPLSRSVNGGQADAAVRAPWRLAFDRATHAADAPALREKLQPDALGRTSPAQQIRGGRLELAWGLAEAFADPPGKAILTDRSNAEYGISPIRLRALDSIGSADREVLLTSPYFIPGPAGVHLLGSVAARGVPVAVLTNSLASTDQPLVHSAYRRYREDLVRAGIQLYELSPNRAGREGGRRFFGLAAAGLHTKCLVIDRQEVFIGSMNFDPRSEHYNTENGMAIHVPAVARDAAMLLNLAKVEAANRVQFNADGHLEWLVPADGVAYEHDSEPDASALLRLWLRLASPLAPESLL